MGQLSLIEHALCPLASRSATDNGGIHTSEYRFTDATGQRRTARVRVISPLGLTSTDEFFLWGLLALTLSQPQPSAEFHATPHYCLRELGVIDQHGRRGGRQYQQFAQSLSRLSAVTYQNDGFYDPLRREHRQVAFGFLSYSLPLAAGSSRAWRIVWDGVFLELAAAVGGHLRFDLAIYRQLDPASRRLFLLVSKLFRRRAKAKTPPFELRYLGERVLGFSSTLATRDLRIKVKRCIQRLVQQCVVADADGFSSIRSRGDGAEVVELIRGPYFERRTGTKQSTPIIESPLAELMRQTGLDDWTISRCLAQYSTDLLQQWLDITLAARERHGESFFRKSAAAYFLDNVKNAAQGKRTPPDWWHDLVRDERRKQAKSCRQERSKVKPATADDPNAGLAAAVERQFRSVGQSGEDAEANARQFVQSCRERPGKTDPAALFRFLR